MTNWATRRWRGEVPLQTLLWRDMLLRGTLVNVLATAVAFAVLAATDRVEWAAALHFAPLPLNLFLLACVWRSPEPHAAARGLSVVWLLVVLVL